MTNSFNISLSETVTGKAFQAFLDAARRYCTFVEMAHNDHPKDALQLLQDYLAALYSLGLGLPQIYVSHDLDLYVDLSDKEKKAIRHSINNKIPFSYYRLVLNSTSFENEASIGTGDLIDDLEEIYCDIKCSLILFEKDDLVAKESAVWKLKFDYENHWNTHCIEALQAIHQYLSNN